VINTHLACCCPQIQYDPELGHGGILLSPAFQAEFVGNLRAMLLAR
jgi:hypothetical protein